VTKNPCYYGIDTPDKHELIASKHTIEEIAEYIGVDSLAYLSTEGLYRAVESTQGKYCDACFSGNYPAGMPVQIKPKRQQMLFERD
jgi:amidophosphoribosyltransferase